jgi:hypothetical protein
MRDRIEEEGKKIHKETDDTVPLSLWNEIRGKTLAGWKEGSLSVVCGFELIGMNIQNTQLLDVECRVGEGGEEDVEEWVQKYVENIKGGYCCQAGRGDGST